MTLTETALKKLTKEEIITLALDLQVNFNQDLKCIKKDLFELRETSLNLRPNLLSLNKVNNVLRNKMIQVERKSWSNEQYSRRECL